MRSCRSFAVGDDLSFVDFALFELSLVSSLSERFFFFNSSAPPHDVRTSWGHPSTNGYEGAYSVPFALKPVLQKRVPRVDYRDSLARGCPSAGEQLDGLRAV